MCIRDSNNDARVGDFGSNAKQRVKRVVMLDFQPFIRRIDSVSYTHLRAHETVLDLVCRLLLEKKKQLNPTSCV